MNTVMYTDHEFEADMFTSYVQWLTTRTPHKLLSLQSSHSAVTSAYIYFIYPMAKSSIMFLLFTKSSVETETKKNACSA